MTTHNEILERFEKEFMIKLGEKVLLKGNGNITKEDYLDIAKELHLQTQATTKREMCEKEIEYWKNIFDNRPKDRDLESDTIAQNFARIEIEKWEAILTTLLNEDTKRE